MIDSNVLARLRLALIPGLGPITQLCLVRRFGTAAAVWDDLAEVGRFAGPAVAYVLARGPDAALVERTLRWQEQPAHSLIPFEDARYPAMLREVADPPGLLYARGDVGCLQRPSLAIVGSRNATPQGLHDARAIANTLSGTGLTIVSGLALGIDAAAHLGGLEGRGSSVAVTGTGPDRDYPRRNRDLAARIAREGCIITEFALGTPPLPGNFPRRNRLISGLARAVLVVEANERSGSLVTAGYALQQDRDVFAMPGSIHSPLSKGCHKLIKDGAALVESAADVLAALGLPCGDERSRPMPTNRLSPDPLLHEIGFAPLSPDQIALRTGLSAAAIAARLSRLQLEGRVEEVAGGRFQRVERAR